MSEKGYRDLEEGERIQEGDVSLADNCAGDRREWELVASCWFGARYRKNLFNPIRRPIKEGKGL